MKDEDAQAEPSAYYRHANGTIISFGSRSTSSVRIETVTREIVETGYWRFRQPNFTLFWLRSGIRPLEVEVGGRSASIDGRQTDCLASVPPGMISEGLMSTDKICSYDVVSIDRSLFGEGAAALLERPLTGFSDHTIQGGLRELMTWRDDATFPLMADGWTLQTIARLQKLQTGDNSRIGAAPLSASVLRLTDDYIRSRLHEPIELVDLADLAGMSVRHFSRGFKQMRGETPARFVFRCRLERAQRLLRETSYPLNHIAAVCGFSHPQHLSNSFRRLTGMTPTQYRAQFAE